MNLIGVSIYPIIFTIIIHNHMYLRESLLLFLLPLLTSSIFLHKEVEAQQQFCLQDDIRKSRSLSPAHAHQNRPQDQGAVPVRVQGGAHATHERIAQRKRHHPLSHLAALRPPQLLLHQPRTQVQHRLPDQHREQGQGLWQPSRWRRPGQGSHEPGQDS